MSDKPESSVLAWARKVQAIAQTGLHFTQNAFDRERFTKLKELTDELVAAELDIPLGEARAIWDKEVGYATPKVGVRGGVFDGDEVLLVRERADGKWALPGGWVDVGESPSGAIEREILEESGYSARAVKLAMLIDRNKHPFAPAPYHVYKLYFLCERTGGVARTSSETDDVGFFPLNALPELSPIRTLRSQIERLYVHHCNRALATDFD